MSILDRLKLNQKLLVLVLVPLLLVVYFAVSQTLTAWTLRGGAQRLSDLAALGVRVSGLVHELQKERGASAGFLGSRGAKFGSELAAQRQDTDVKQQVLHDFVSSFDAPAYGGKLQQGLDIVLGELDQIAAKRGLIDRFELPLGDALAYYTGMNAKFLGLISEMSKISPDERLAIDTAAYANFLQSKERAGIERAVLANTFAKDAFGPGLFRRFLGLQTTQDNYLNVFDSLASDEHRQLLKDTLQGEAVTETLRMRDVATAKAETGGFGVDPVYWFEMQTGKINLLKQVEDRLAADLEANAVRAVSAANIALTASLSISLLGIALTLLLGWVLTRNILRQLGGEPIYIAQIADSIARGELETPLHDEGNARRSGIYASIVSMRDDLRTRIAADREAAQETLRIKTALDCVNAGVMVADGAGSVIYVNGSVQRMFSDASADLRKVIPTFDATSLKGQQVDTMLRNSAGSGRVTAAEGGAGDHRIVVGERTFRVITNPVKDAGGECLGTAIEWADLTAELAEAGRERERLEEERMLAAQNTRIKNALDNVSSCVLMADTDLNVVYLNQAAQGLFRDVEEEFRSVLREFDSTRIIGRSMDGFCNDKVRRQDLLGSLDRRNESEVVYGDRTLKVVTNPVFNDTAEKLGFAIEWTDRSTEVAVENEVDGIVAAASRGDLGQRIELGDKHGFFRRLSEGVNQLIDVVETSFDDIAAAMDRLSQGDLTHLISRDYQGTFGKVKEGVNGTTAKLQEVVGKLRESSDIVSNAAGEIASGNNNLSQRTEQNASSLEETAASVEQLTSTVRNNADNAQQANQVARTAQQQAESGHLVVGQAIEAMHEINSSSSKIAEIIGVIDEIAFQTNLLALNASVEAARAGEQGRGFAVVATEVRNLASRSAQAAKEIKELINDSVNKVHSGSDLVNRSGETLQGIVVSIKKVADIVAEITAASAEQSAGIDQISRAVTSMDEATQQNAALAEQTSAAAGSLEEKAQEMQSIIDFFRTAGANARRPQMTPKPRAAVVVPSARTVAQAPAAVRRASPAAPVQAADDGEDWEEF